MLKKPDLGRDVVLLILIETVSPRLELVGVFDLPFHAGNIPSEEYAVKGIYTAAIVVLTT